MWRSIAAKSKVAAKKFSAATQKNHHSSRKVATSKTLIPNNPGSFPQHFFTTWVFSETSHQDFRFFSTNLNETETETEHSSSLVSGQTVEDENAHIDHFAPENDNFSMNSGLHSDDTVSFVDNGDTQMDHFATGIENDADVAGRDSHTPGDESELEGEVFEIDVEKFQSVLSLLQSTVDGSLESTLNGMCLDLREEFMVKVLETPHILGENLISFFKWVAKKKHGNFVTTGAVDALVQAVCSNPRAKDAYALCELINDIGEKNPSLLNVGILNQLIALFSKLGKAKAAWQVFDNFGDFGCVPDSETFYYTIEALCRRSFFDWASSVNEKMLDVGALPDSEKVGKIMSWFCKGSEGKDAYLVYMMAKEKNKYPPLHAVNFLICTLSQMNETVKLAVDMLDDFSGETQKRAIKPFAHVVCGLCRIKDADGAKKLLSKMITEGPPPGNAVFNSVISCYSKAGDMKEAIEIMKLMQSRGLKPDVYTYTVIMSGYASGGQMEEAHEILLEAKKKHSKLTPVTYHTLIRGYCKLEQFDKALELLAEMKKFGVQPNEDEYNKLIQSLCLKALDWEKAEKLLGEMTENGLYLNEITRGLIRAVKEMTEEGLETKVSIGA
uniref:Pentatricopeptide repeat-containing protein n=1 Tax=Rhizophora mucronata TaxID=61149 RepID=A0A2P2IK69_RHIMU